MVNEDVSKAVLRAKRNDGANARSCFVIDGGMSLLTSDRTARARRRTFLGACPGDALVDGAAAADGGHNQDNKQRL